MVHLRRRPGHRLWAALTAALYAVMVALSPAKATDAYSEDAVKAAFLYRFAGYVQWPSEAPGGGQLTIAVLGAKGVAQELQRLLADRTIGSRGPQVRAISHISELGDARMLYVAPEFRGDPATAIASIGSRGVLVVTDHEGGLDDGAAINFRLIDRHLTFEVSLSAAERAGLKISSELLSVAVRVQGSRSHQ